MGSPEPASENPEEARLRSHILQLQTESGILDRIVYKNKNQHRHCPYFQALLKVRRDAKLLHSARLGEILNALFPVIDGRKTAQKAYLPARQKRNYPSGKHNYQERLLGVARLLSQMAEPILKAAIQISFLLAKSFFTGFSLTILALLARLRVLVQQILLDVVSVFNKVSSLSQKKHSVKLIQEGIEAFREYYPLSGDVLTLECVWEEDKFVLLEKTDNSNSENRDEDLAALPLETPIQYKTIELFNEVQSSEHEFSSEKTLKDFPAKNSRPIDIEPPRDSSTARSATPSVDLDIVHREDKQKSATASSEGIPSVGSVPSPKSGETDPRRKKVAFVAVRRSDPPETNTAGPSKKMKLDSLASDAMKNDDPFLSLLLGGSTKTSLF